MQTLLLDPTAWDLTVDASGNIAVASGAYAMAQDAASAIRLFAGELWYDTTQGVPYFPQILGGSPPLSLVSAKLVSAALTVPGVVSAEVSIVETPSRAISGTVTITGEDGQTATAAF